MDQNDYVKEAMRTDCEYDNALKTRCFSVVRLTHATLGIVSEAGEFADAIKKHVFANKPLDFVNLIEEIGDMFWYFAVVADEFGFSFIDIMNANIAKLKLRYPEKFTEEDSANRNVINERKLLEKEIKINPISITANTPNCPEESNWVKNTFVKKENKNEIVTIDIDKEMWESIKKAASESNWIPEEYFNNDWVYDVCEFLKNGHNKDEKTNTFIDEDYSFNRKESSPLTALNEVSRSKRAEEWIRFSNEVLAHIENYTVPQYGDYPNDQMTEWTIPECFKAVTKRVARYGRNSREGQQNLDFKKMAHEVCIAWAKYNHVKSAH